MTSNSVQEAAGSDSSAAGVPPDAAQVPLAANVFGWYGTLAILSAYGLSSMGWLEQGTLYQFLNLTGAAGVGLVCFLRRAWQPMCLEVAWAIIAILALVRSLAFA